MGLTATLALGAGCGSQDKTEAQSAAQALDQGLKAHGEGRLDDAEKLYREVLVLDPSNKWAYYNLGVIEQSRGQAVMAEANYRQALAVDQNFGIAIYNLAVLLTGSNPQEALRLYRQLIEIEPDSAVGHLNLGFLLISLGQEQEGRAELNKAVALDPALAQRIPASPSPSPGGPETPRRSPTP